MTNFVRPDLEDLFSRETAAAPTAPAAPASPTPGFNPPELGDLMAGSVMEYWDPEQKRVVSPAEGFRTTFRPAGLDTGIELPEWASQLLAGAGAQLTAPYLGAKQRAFEVGSALPGPLGAMAERQLSDIPGMERQRRRAGREIGMTGAGTAGMLVGDLAPAMTLGRYLPTTGTSAAGVGGLYGLTTPTLPGESVGMNTLGGAALGYGGKLVTDVGGKLIHSAGGSLIPPWLQPFTGGVGRLPPEVEARLALAQRTGLPVRAGDVTEAPGIMRMEAFAEAVPASGMTNFVKRQIGEARRYFTGAKERLGNKFGFRETTEAVQGVLRNYEKLGKESERLYDQLGRVAQATGYKTNVTTQELGPKLANLQRLDNNFWTRPFVTDDVKPLLAGIADGSITRLPFDQWQRVKRALGGMQAVIEKQERAGTVPGELVGAAKQAYGAAMQDIERWGRSARNSKVKAAYDRATTHYRDNLVPFEAPENDLLRKIVYGKFDDTEYANLGALFTEPSAQKLEQLVKYSDGTGRRALDNLMKRQVLEKTTGYSHPTGVMPVAAAEGFERISPQARQLLPSGAGVAEDYARAGRMIERAGDLPMGLEPLERLPHWATQASPLLFPAAGVAVGLGGGGVDPFTGAALGGLTALAAGRGATALSTTRPGLRFMASPSNVLPGGPLSYVGAPLGLEYLERLVGNR